MPCHSMGRQCEALSPLMTTPPICANDYAADDIVHTVRRIYALKSPVFERK